MTGLKWTGKSYIIPFNNSITMTKIVSGDPTTTTHAVVFEDKLFSESNSSADKPTMVASTVWNKERAIGTD